MTHKHEEEVPIALEAFITRLGDLELVLGNQIAPVLNGVRADLIAAMAARDRGDRAGAIAQIGTAMDRLSALAEQLDPGEAVLMRALAQSFRTALLRGDRSQAQQGAVAMLERSGAVERKK